MKLHYVNKSFVALSFCTESCEYNKEIPKSIIFSILSFVGKAARVEFLIAFFYHITCNNLMSFEIARFFLLHMYAIHSSSGSYQQTNSKQVQVTISYFEDSFL